MVLFAASARLERDAEVPFEDGADLLEADALAHHGEIAEVDDQWYSPDAIYFRVRTQDGDYFVLRHDEAQDVWSLDAFRSARERQPLPEAPQVALG